MVDLLSPAGCPMSEWSVWSQCSCVSQRQQRYRVALSPATRGQQCTAVETQSRSCSVSHCNGELTTTVKGKICIREAYLRFCYCSYQLQFYFEHTNQGNQTPCCAFDPAHVYDCHVLVHVDTIQCFFFFTHICRLWSPICVLSMWRTLWEAVCIAGPWRSLFRCQGVYTWLLLPTGEYWISQSLFYIQ